MSLIIIMQSFTHVSLHVYIPLYTQDCSSPAMLFLVVSMYTVLVHSNLHSPKHNAHYPHDQLKITTKPGKQFVEKMLPQVATLTLHSLATPLLFIVVALLLSPTQPGGVSVEYSKSVTRRQCLLIRIRPGLDG